MSAQHQQANLTAVATQVVDVGVDISVEVLHTELAPPASLMQRAGRCAHYPGDTGTVTVYPVGTYIPYAFESDQTLKHEMDATLAWVNERQGAVFDFDHEQELVNAVRAARTQNIALRCNWSEYSALFVAEYEKRLVAAPT